MVAPSCMTVATCYNTALSGIANLIQCEGYGKFGVDGLSKAVNLMGALILAWGHYNHVRSSDKLTQKNNPDYDLVPLKKKTVVKDSESMAHITIIVISLLCAGVSAIPYNYSNNIVMKTISGWSLEMLQKCTPDGGPSYYVKNMIYPIATNASYLTYNVKFIVIAAGIAKLFSSLATLLGTGLLILKNSTGPHTPFKAYPLKIMFVVFCSAVFMALGLYQIIVGSQANPTKLYMNQLELCNKAANVTLV